MHHLIIGPTGIGKSAYAIELAQKTGQEIISADALQVYKKLNIGTAKLTAAEMQGVPHHLIDVVLPDVQYNVADYIKAVKELFAQNPNKTYIICGGTGLYLNALINGLAFPLIEKNETVRQSLKERLAQEGNQALWAELKNIDPIASQKIHPNDEFRLIRALEVYQLTGKPISEQAKKEPSILGSNYQTTGLTMERDALYGRLDKRVDTMVEKGLLAEVHGLLNEGYTPELTALQAIGYKEMIGYIQEDYDLDTAIAMIKQGTRNFAKRQYTWFRAFSNIQWREIYGT